MIAQIGEINLLALIGGDTPLKKAATTEGGEWHGPCPFCGGEDRFYVQPNHKPKGRWACRICNPKGGDAADYVLLRDGLQKPSEAFAALGVALPERTNGSSNGNGKQHPAKMRVSKEPKEPVDKSKQTMTRAFMYHDETGKPVYEVVRFDNPKEYKPRDAHGWAGVFKRNRRLLYNLPSVLRAVADDSPILFVEGEKTVEALRHFNYITTSIPGGAKAPLPDQLVEWLKGGSVIILRDQDVPGHEFGTRLAKHLYGKVKSLKVIDLPVRFSDTGGEDPEDWANQGGTRQQLETIIRNAPEFEPGFNLTDLGNSKRLVSQHGRDLRYCHVWGKWLIWDGKRWSTDETGEIERRAKSVVISIYAEAANDQLTRDDRDSIVSWARSSESKRKIRDMIDLAQSEPGIPVTPDQLDRNGYLLNCNNGCVDLRTGQIGEHRRDDLITKLCPINYDPKATAPTWNKFLHRIMAGNAEILEFLQRAIGYSLTGDTGEQVLFMLYGMGANGKSTFLNALQDLLGDYANQAPSAMLVKKRDAAPTNDVARLMGARFVTAIETGDGQQMDEQLVKQITGGDKIAARFLHREFFEFRPVAKIFVATNHKPVIRGSDNAIWRRIRLIPFTETIPPEERDKHLPDKLQAEFPGILAWAIAGCVAWQSEGLPVPEAVQLATDAYRAEMDILTSFINDCCTLNPHATITAADLYTAYSNWCEDTGERTLSQRKIGLALTERGYRNERITSGPNKGRIMWVGVGLADEPIQQPMIEISASVNEVNEVNEETVIASRRENTRGDYTKEGSLGSLHSLGNSPLRSPLHCVDCGTMFTASNGNYQALPLIQGGGFLCKTCSDKREGTS